MTHFRCELVVSSTPLDPLDWNDVTLQVNFQTRDVTLSVGDVITTQSFTCDASLSSVDQLSLVLGDDGEY